MLIAGLLIAHPGGAMMLLTCAGIGCALAAVFFASACRAEPRFTNETREKAITLRTPLRPGPGEQRLTLSLTRICLWNSGRGVLRPASHRFAVRIPEGVGVRASRVVRANNPGCGFQMGPASGGVLPINYDWASRGDGVEIEVLHTSGSLELTGAAPAVRAPVLAPRPGATAGGEAARFSQRAVAACVDATLILAAFLISVLIQRIVAGPPDPERGLAALYLSLLAIFSIIYGALFSIFETDTIGTRRAGLKLVSLDGTPASPRDRSMRLLGKVLGIAGFGFGLVWAFVDPARLPWHDRVSRTFPVAVHRAE